MDTERDVQAPTIASPAAFGFGPSLAMPTLLRMMTDIGNLDEEEDDSVDGEIESTPMRYLEDSLRQQLSPEVCGCVCLRPPPHNSDIGRESLGELDPL